MKKSYQVVGSKGDLYTVEFSDETGTLKTKCNCRAGICSKTVCKHVLSVFATEDDWKAAYPEITEAVQNFNAKNEEVEKLKAEAEEMKKKLSQFFK